MRLQIEPTLPSDGRHSRISAIRTSRRRRNEIYPSRVERRVKKMALRESRETPRGRYLLEIVNKATAEALTEWPMPTKDDLVLIGSVIVLYSYIDFNLRRFIEVLERAILCSDTGR